MRRVLLGLAMGAIFSAGIGFSPLGRDLVEPDPFKKSRRSKGEKARNRKHRWK